ncbi:MAG: UPF0104 family protein [Chloroflexi bacterium]|nr:UPF0104 family protein [Chloroflexota bacterium]MDL1882934.1 flippase-like domain-containing protein [Anaerolineae bacterium CFX8]
MRRLVFLIASVLVSGLFLWLALRDVPHQEIIENIRQADLGWALIALVTVGLGLWTRAVRWRGLVNYKVTTMQAFHMLNITMLLNQLPLRAGEVARSLLATRSGVPLMTAATSIIVERLLDTLLVVIWLSVALTQAPNAQPDAVRLAILFGAAAVAAFIVLIVFARRPAIAHRILALVERLLPFIKRLNLGRLLDHVLDGVQPLTHWRSAIHAIGWTIISWSVSAVTFCCMMLAIGIQDNVVLMAILSLTLASFSIAIPVSVAALGPYEGAVRLAGDAAGVSQVLSTSAGFLSHGINILGYAILGTIGMLAMGISLGDVMKAGESKKEEPAGAAAAEPGGD